MYAAAALGSVGQESGGAGVDLLDGLCDGWDARWKQQRMASSSTRFSVVLDGTRLVLQADSDAAASALWCRAEVRHPTRARLSWRWKIDSALDT